MWEIGLVPELKDDGAIETIGPFILQNSAIAECEARNKKRKRHKNGRRWASGKVNEFHREPGCIDRVNS